MLCPPREKAEREADNGRKQFDYITELVMDPERRIRQVRESHVTRLQALAVEGIYPCGGEYRDALTRISITGSRHTPPEPALVPSRVRDALSWINEAQESGRPALERAAFALWRFNWIHPFRGGNGRTSRCLAYLILCMDLGSMMPGVPTLPTRIYERRDDYVAALQKVDASVEGGDDAMDLSPMTSYLEDLVTQQLATAIKQLKTSRG